MQEKPEEPNSAVEDAEIVNTFQVKLDDIMPFIPVDELEASQYENIVDGVRDINASEKTQQIIRQRLENALNATDPQKWKDRTILDKSSDDRNARGI